MCPHKEWFFKFEEVDGGVVYMGSGDVNYITWMSSIQLRNHDGSIRVLTDVWYLYRTLLNSLCSFSFLPLVILLVALFDALAQQF